MFMFSLLLSEKEIHSYVLLLHSWHHSATQVCGALSGELPAFQKPLPRSPKRFQGKDHANIRLKKRLNHNLSISGSFTIRETAGEFGSRFARLFKNG
jgi:hypothetical protein